MLQPMEQLMLVFAAKGMLPDSEIERRARAILDANCGKTDKPYGEGPRLLITDFLESKGETPLKKEALQFGVNLASRYFNEHGHYPSKQSGNSFVYYESDRPLMESVWADMQEERERA